MSFVLVADDNPEEARLIIRLLEQAGLEASHVFDGAAAFEAVSERRPDLLITDMRMPGMDGLELVRRLAHEVPSLPVVLVTGYGSGETAIRALRQGAAGYVPKSQILEELIPTIEGVLEVVQERYERTQVLHYLQGSRTELILPNEQELIGGVVALLQGLYHEHYPECADSERLQIGTAMREALRNAMHHGNLEISSEYRKHTSEVYDRLVRKRLADERYSRRRVRIAASYGATTFTCVVGDEGAGFDPTEVPDPTDAENLLKASGRGLYLITSFMDEVHFNDSGNEITMVKRISTPGSAGNGQA